MNAASHRPLVLVVTGLSAEARIAGGPGVVAIAAPPAGLASKLDGCRAEVSAVVSFGLAGGLMPGAKAGTLVVSTSVLADDREWDCDQAAVDRLHYVLDGAGVRTLSGKSVCREAPVLTRNEKTALHAETGAVVVDTESHLAAAYAERRAVPFVALRAICDTADEDLPPLAVRAIDPEGRLDWRAIGQELGNRPGQLAALPRTALATMRALRSLRRARRLLGDRFGL